MALEILRDRRLAEVEWRDLCDLGPLEVASEVMVYVPWLVASCVFAHFAFASHLGWLAPALISSFMFFLCGLRLVHNAFHHAVGVSPRVHEALMFILSPLMMSAMHAVQWNHLRHHRHCMDEDDVEASSARMPGWRALITGPRFPIRLHHAALTLAEPRTQRFIALELIAMAAMGVLAFGVFEEAWLRYHVIAMTTGQCFSAFFAVWTVHHDCDRSHFVARTLRNDLKSFVSYNMFFHVEHHLFPAVPTCHLPELSKRLDGVAPALHSKNVW